MSIGSLERRLSATDHVFYLHIPKAAGTALRQYIEGHFSPKETFPHYLLPEIQQAEQLPQQEYVYYQGHFNYDLMRQIIGREPVCITMLRDPIERTLSQFGFMGQSDFGGPATVNTMAVDLDKVRSLTADEFFHDPELVAEGEFTDRQTHFIASKHDLLAFPWLANALGYSIPPHCLSDTQPNLAEAKRRLDAFAFVGLTERFTESIALLAYTFGWQPVADVQVRNVSRNRLRRDELAPETLARLLEINARDSALYAHAQALFECRYTQMVEDLRHRYGSPSDTEPLSYPELFDLLERHYEERFAELNLPAASAHITFEQPITGWGWHSVEDNIDRTKVRWTGPGTTSTIDVPLVTDRDMRIRCRVLTALTPDILGSLSLTVNDVAIPFESHPDAYGVAIFEGDVPQHVLSNGKPFTRLSFHVDRTVSPMQIDPTSTDDRQLGVLINWIRIEPK